MELLQSNDTLDTLKSHISNQASTLSPIRGEVVTIDERKYLAVYIILNDTEVPMPEYRRLVLYDQGSNRFSPRFF